MQFPFGGHNITLASSTFHRHTIARLRLFSGSYGLQGKASVVSLAYHIRCIAYEWGGEKRSLHRVQHEQHPDIFERVRLLSVCSEERSGFVSLDSAMYEDVLGIPVYRTLSRSHDGYWAKTYQVEARRDQLRDARACLSTS